MYRRNIRRNMIEVIINTIQCEEIQVEENIHEEIYEEIYEEKCEEIFEEICEKKYD